MTQAIKELGDTLRAQIPGQAYENWPVIGPYSLGFQKGLTDFSNTWAAGREIFNTPLQRPCTVSAPDVNNGNVVSLKVD